MVTESEREKGTRSASREEKGGEQAMHNEGIDGNTESDGGGTRSKQGREEWGAEERKREGARDGGWCKGGEGRQRE